MNNPKIVSGAVPTHKWQIIYVNNPKIVFGTVLYQMADHSKLEINPKIVYDADLTQNGRPFYVNNPRIVSDSVPTPNGRPPVQNYTKCQTILRE